MAGHVLFKGKQEFYFVDHVPRALNNSGERNEEGKHTELIWKAGDKTIKISIIKEMLKMDAHGPTLSFSKFVLTNWSDLFKKEDEEERQLKIQTVRLQRYLCR